MCDTLKINPDFVSVVCPKVCDAFGFIEGECLQNLHQVIVTPDRDGYDIAVYSVKYSRSIGLLPGEYRIIYGSSMVIAGKIMRDFKKRMAGMHQEIDAIYGGYTADSFAG